MTVALLCAVALGLFVQAVVRLRRRGRPDLAGAGRVACFLAGLGLFPVALLALDAPADGNLTLHMTQHVLVGDLAPALLNLAVRGPLALFLLPAAILAPLARSPLRRLLSVLLRPQVAYGLWAANLAVWHVPWLYDRALEHAWLHYAEHACWTVAGLLVWSILLDDRRSAGRRVALAAAMFGSGQVLADVLAFTFHPLYPSYPHLLQQHLAGVVMMAEQVLTLGPLAFVLLWPRRRRPFRAVPA